MFEEPVNRSSHRRGFWHLLRAVLSHPVWAGIAGVIGALALIVTILGLLLALPQAAPLRSNISHALSGTPGSTPTTTEVTPTATVPIPTATIAPIDTSTPSAPASYDSLPLYATGSFTPNWRLDCGGCDEAMLVTVSKVSVDQASENMVWTVTLYNHTANPQSALFDTFSLTDPNGIKHYVTGTVSQGAIVNAGQSKELQGTFGFVPRHGGAYILNADLAYEGPDSCCYSREYGPQTLKF